MKKFTLLITTLVLCNLLNAKDLVEGEYQKNGDSRTGIVMCDSDPIFRVVVTNPFEKFNYTSIQLVPYKDFISGFEVIDKPSKMNPEAGHGYKKFNWTPLRDFKEEDHVYLTVKPIIDSKAADTISLGCQTFKIELPLKRDLAPVTLVQEQLLQIPISGDQTEIKYDLLGGRGGNGDVENLNIFKHDDDKDLTFQWIESNIKFETSTDNGILTFKHYGPVPADNKFQIRIKAIDHLQQKSQEAVIKCELIANPDESPVWNLADASEEIIWEAEKNEGTKIVVKPFKAINKASNKVCIIEPIGQINGDWDIKHNSFEWTPDYDLIPDADGMEKQTIKIPFEAKSETGITSKCTLVLKIGNSTKPSDIEIYNKAKGNFKKAETKFVEIMRQPLCYIRYASERILTKQNQLEAISAAYKGVDEIFLLTAMANPVALAVYKSLGLLISTLEAAGDKKSKRVADKASQLSAEITNYKKLSSEFTQKEGTLKSFKTNTECDELLALSVKLVNEIERLQLEISKFTTIGALFNRNNENRIQQSCN